MYNYYKGRQLEGTFSADPSIGYWITSSLRIMKGWGNGPDSAWPYSGDKNKWPPSESPNIDSLAKNNRISGYQRIRSVHDCKLVLSDERPLGCALEITNQWFSAKNGEIEIPAINSEIVGSHSVLLVGYDDKKSHFILRNSWGVKWGDKGYGYLPYEYFEKYVLEAWFLFIIPESLIPSLTNSKELRLKKWHTTTSLNTVCFFELYDSSDDEYLGWANVVMDKDFLDVEELFIKPSYRGLDYCKEFISEFISMSSKHNLPLRFWIPHSDNNPLSLQIIEKIIKPLGLNIASSGVRWAAYKAE